MRVGLAKGLETNYCKWRGVDGWPCVYAFTITCVFTEFGFWLLKGWKGVYTIHYMSGDCTIAAFHSMT